MKRTLLIAGLIVSGLSYSQTEVFDYSGALDSIQIPACVDSIEINVWGAQGAPAPDGGTGGFGGYATGKIDVTPGEWIYINVGGQDGYNGGGAGGLNGYTDFSGTVHGDAGGNGGGASDVRIGGSSLAERIIVAGGGGGGGHVGVWPSCQPATPGGNGGDGGSGGDGTGGSSSACSCGGGGGIGGIGAIASTPGTGSGYNAGNCGGGYDGAGADGSLGLGGDGNVNFWNGTGGGGGGGGGYYGGGAGGNGWDTTPGGGGGGGSSYIGGVSEGDTIVGVRSGDGRVTITFINASPIIDPTISVSGFTLTAVQSGMTYQWVDCGNAYAPIAGATNQSYTATYSSDFAVVIDNGVCTDTSVCETIAGASINEVVEGDVKIFPIPAQNELTIQLVDNQTGFEVSLFDLSGKLIYQTAEQGNWTILDLSTLEAGTYIVEVKTSNGVVTSQVVRQ